MLDEGFSRLFILHKRKYAQGAAGRHQTDYPRREHSLGCGARCRFRPCGASLRSKLGFSRLQIRQEYLIGRRSGGSIEVSGGMLVRVDTFYPPPTRA